MEDGDENWKLEIGNRSGKSIVREGSWERKMSNHQTKYLPKYGRLHLIFHASYSMPLVGDTNIGCH